MCQSSRPSCQEHEQGGSTGYSHATCKPSLWCKRLLQDVCEVQPVLDFIRHHADQLVAVGEIGLDFSPHVVGNNTDLREVQQAVFQHQVLLANELGLPVNVHSRSAGHYAIEALISNGAQGALLHAFDGKLGHALKGAQAGFYFSVPPSIVRSPQNQKLVKGLPLDRLVLETDSPALGPEKAGVNVPANIQISCAEIARIKGLSVAEVQQITTENALRLFPRLNNMSRLQLQVKTPDMATNSAVV